MHLIAMLASDAQPVQPDAVQRRYVAALGWGIAGASLLMAVFLGVRPDIAAASRLPMFWVKMALPLALLLIAIVGTMRLARPGIALGLAAHALPFPVMGIWAMSAAVLAAAAPGERASMLLGGTWTSCTILIVLLSLPVFIGAFWAMKGLAPTRPRWPARLGAHGRRGRGARLYCLHCPEMAPPFLGTWYVLGMALPALAGAMLGRRLLRW